jgi:glycosyltransferase involved in cell wall biosynthesis
MGRLKKIEQRACNESQIILTTSEHDKCEIATYFSINPKKIVVVPNGTDTKNILPPTPEHKISAKKTLNCKRKYSVLFFGSGHLPNKEAAQYIVNHLAPSLPDFDFLIAGNVSKNIKRTSSNVTVFGEVTDEMKELILSASDIALNPVISGSGTNLKILEYLSAGIPVISTSVGARGLAIEFDKDIIVVSREKFKDKIIELSQNSALYKNIQHNGRSAVVEKYDWEKITDILIQTLSEIEKTPGIINFQ